jgi:hypothetical protein
VDLKEIVWGAMDWIDLAEDMDQWRVLVNTAIKPHHHHHHETEPILEKPPIMKPLKNFPAICENRGFISVFTKSPLVSVLS